ncbi:hypothetical protein GCM10027445_66710 [Amycolatopsis endophytica]|uniref:DUF3618 domain-containing protein n=1 Tax=Amycolatopsis endophytica TaxID=860233 RepID=A0A853B4S9_9PSEU|nr:DUF3618 domain-containing protein [Amycolatopsis endophytica]NYI89751.1 hypothetical protein [Amycolatopsis endophytica]
MARDPDTIEREIVKAREALATTLDQLGEKASPKRLADNAKTTVRGKLDDPKIKFSLIGAGVLVAALLVRKLFR